MIQVLSSIFPTATTTTKGTSTWATRRGNQGAACQKPPDALLLTQTAREIFTPGRTSHATYTLHILYEDLHFLKKKRRQQWGWRKYWLSGGVVCHCTLKLWICTADRRRRRFPIAEGTKCPPRSLWRKLGLTPLALDSFLSLFSLLFFSVFFVPLPSAQNPECVVLLPWLTNRIHAQIRHISNQLSPLKRMGMQQSVPVH